MEKRVIDEIRRIAEVPEDITDKEICDKTNSTKLAALLKLRFALCDFGNAILDELPLFFGRWFGR